MSETTLDRGYSTIHHIPFEKEQTRSDIAYGDKTPSESTFESHYTPSESIVGVTDPEQAYYHAQGFAVNKHQDAVHAVRSACPGDIIETVLPDGTHSFYLVEPIGFTELPFSSPISTRPGPHATASNETAV